MEVFHATILALAFLTTAVHAQRGHDGGLDDFRRFLERERSNPSYFKSKQDLHRKLWRFLEKEQSHARPQPEHVNDLLNYLRELGRLDKSLTRFSEHAKDRETVDRVRDNLRRFFDKEFERARSFNEQYYEKIGSPNARRTGSPDAQDYKKGEARVRAFAKNFRKLQKLLAKARQRSKRFSDRSARESSLTLTKKRTENGETTITNGRGNPTSGSGSFHVKS
ncbi:hypothetical protein V3C99_010109 [Haemonchus contortus]